MDKSVLLEVLVEIVQQYRQKHKTIVFTNGCFDILHAGHVKYLEYAAGLGDVLILGINSDISVRSIKGEKRPVIGQEHRVQVVSALGFVDHVVLFDRPDPLVLIEQIQPDILVKGADWAEEDIIGADVVKSHGGRIERVRLEPEISTTKIIERIGVLYYDQR